MGHQNRIGGLNHDDIFNTHKADQSMTGMGKRVLAVLG